MGASRLREKKSVLAKRALYAAAMELFREHGFENTTVEEIAERAGFSRATFFNHFGTKQGVLRFYGQGLEDLAQRLAAGTGPDASPLELIRGIVFGMAREVASHREEVKIIYTSSLCDPGYLLEKTPARRRVGELLTGLVERAQKQGQMRADLPAQELTRHISAVYQGVVLSIIAESGGLEALLDSGWRFILGGATHAGSAPR